MSKEMGILEDNFLERNNYNYEAVSLKILHLIQENTNLHQSLADLETQLQSVRIVNQQLLSKSPSSLQKIVQELTKQNNNLQKTVFRIIKTNQELSSDVLMKSQIIIQNQNQFREIISNHENKILELRTNLQAKQALIASIESKTLAERGDMLNVPTRASLRYFNEINELRFLNEGYHMQNLTLQLLITSKNQQLSQLNRKLSICQKSLKNGENWLTYHTKVLNTTELQKTKQKSTQKLKLEQQLSRYDNKYKHIVSQYSYDTQVSSQIHNLKLLIFELYNDFQNIQEEKQKLQRTIKNKDKDLQSIKIAYRQLEMEMKHQRIEIDFYRQNFKELTRVTTQQKIKYFHDYYQKELPLVKKTFKNMRQLVDCWKKQQQTNFNQRRMLSKLTKKSDLKRNRRSLSCIPKCSAFCLGLKNICSDLKTQNSIISFINETPNLVSEIEYPSEKVQNIKTRDQQNVSFGEISEIEKVMKSIQKFSRRERKQFFLKEEL